jgi:excisionase family DNA binding protein
MLFILHGLLGNVSHMDAGLVSAKEAARRLGIDRRTIQRAVEDGRLTKHGARAVGPRAAQFDLEEVRRVCVIQASAHGVRRSDMVPAWKQVERFLRESGFDPLDVVGLFLRACLSGADIDFLLYCIERLREGDAVFVSLSKGRTVPPSWTDPLRRYAAKRLRDLAKNQRDTRLPSVGFEKHWKALTHACALAPVDAKPAIVCDRERALADVLLVPQWLLGAPAGLVPVAGGKHSVAHPARIPERASVRAVASKLMRGIEGLGGNAVLDGFICQTLADDSLLYVPDYRDPGADRTILAAQRALQAGCERVGLSSQEAKVLIRAWRVASGDVLDRSHQAYVESGARKKRPGRDDDAPDPTEENGSSGDSGNASDTSTADCDEVSGATGAVQTVDPEELLLEIGFRVSPSTLGAVLGISRVTARRFLQARWLRQGRSKRIRSRPGKRSG